MITSILNMLMSIAINFLYTHYVVDSLDGEAYGYVGLASQMINYVSVITVALTTVSGRFITIELHKGEQGQASKYFNSVLFSNIFMAAVIALVSIPLILNLDSIIQIEPYLLSSVQTLFAFTLINFLITLIGNVYTVATFVTNRLYLSSLGNCITSLIRIALLLLMCYRLGPQITYASITASIASFLLLLYNFFLTRIYVPELHVRLREFDIKKIKELLAAGIWNSVTKLSQILSDGLDLLISNIFIDPFFTGQLSIAYQLTTQANVLISTVSSVFSPRQIYYYAKNDINATVKEVKIGMKIVGFFTSILFAGIVALGREFFALYTPKEDVDLIYSLALLAMSALLISGVTSALSNVFLVTNRLKVNSIVWLIASFVMVLLVVLLLSVTDLGIYAVAGVSKIVGFFINLTFTPIYAAVCLHVSKKTFYPVIVHYMLTTLFLSVLFILIKQILFSPTSWLFFVLDGLILLLIGTIAAFFLLFKKSEREVLLNGILQKLRRKTGV